jgi:solute carrier family 25 (mitochondrial S-adenosylmethionine transporter), member 26
LLLPYCSGALLKPTHAWLIAGGCASATVDVTIHPLDTLKTRAQAPQGFVAAGGYRNLFRGVLAAGLGAVPGGAVFFGMYEYSKSVLTSDPSSHWSHDAAAATFAASMSCLVRTPAAVITQRMQERRIPPDPNQTLCSPDERAPGSMLGAGAACA